MPREGMDTQYTHHGPRGGAGGWGGAHDVLATKRTGRRKGQAAEGCYVTLQVDILAQKPPLGRVPRPAVWGVHLDAPGQRHGPLPCVDPTQSSETGTVWGLRWHNLPRERKGEYGG